MSQEHFPKPKPAEPIPAINYLGRTDRSEVGRNAFFNGRDIEYGVFRKAVIQLKAGDIGGGTMIFQGAPGAGKSALMLECMEAVRIHSTPTSPWVAVSIKPNTLASSVGVMMRIIDAVNEENKRLSKIAPDSIRNRLKNLLEIGGKLLEELSNRGFTVAGISVGGKTQVGVDSNLPVLAEQVFCEAASLLKRVHIVVFVDEAQNTPVKDSTKDVIDCLHSPPGKIPLVAAFFGLSDTHAVLRECGLSRFARRRIVNLEALSMVDAAGSFRRMFDTYYIGADEEKTVWAKTLAQLSQGWPQHVNGVGIAAGQVVHANKMQLERYLLEQALEAGVDEKNDYYTGRLAACAYPPWVYKQLALTAAEHPNGILTHQEVKHIAMPELKETQTSLNEFLINALHAGLLAPVEKLPFHYQFPIPSLGDYLRALPVDLP